MRQQTLLNTLSKKAGITNRLKKIFPLNPLLKILTNNILSHVGNATINEKSVFQEAIISAVRAYEKYDLTTDKQGPNNPELNYMATFIYEISKLALYDFKNGQKNWDLIGKKSFNHFSGNSPNQIIVTPKNYPVDILLVRKNFYKQISDCDDKAWFSLIGCSSAQKWEK